MFQWPLTKSLIKDWGNEWTFVVLLYHNDSNNLRSFSCTDKYFSSLDKRREKSSSFIAFAFIDALGSVVELGCVLRTRHNFDTFWKKISKTKSSNEIWWACGRFSRRWQISSVNIPIFFQFNIMFLLDRPTLTTYLHSSEKYTRFILCTGFLWEQSIFFFIRFLFLLFFPTLVDASPTRRMSKLSVHFLDTSIRKAPWKDSSYRLFSNQQQQQKKLSMGQLHNVVHQFRLGLIYYACSFFLINLENIFASSQFISSAYSCIERGYKGILCFNWDNLWLSLVFLVIKSEQMIKTFSPSFLHRIPRFFVESC